MNQDECAAWLEAHREELRRFTRKLLRGAGAPYTQNQEAVDWYVDRGWAEVTRHGPQQLATWRDEGTLLLRTKGEICVLVGEHQGSHHRVRLTERIPAPEAVPGDRPEAAPPSPADRVALWRTTIRAELDALAEIQAKAPARKNAVDYHAFALIDVRVVLARRHDAGLQEGWPAAIRSGEGLCPWRDGEGLKTIKAQFPEDDPLWQALVATPSAFPTDVELTACIARHLPPAAVPRDFQGMWHKWRQTARDRLPGRRWGIEALD